MRKFKHKITGEKVIELINEQSKGYKRYQLYHNAETIPARLVENTNDWEEIIEVKTSTNTEVKINSK